MSLAKFEKEPLTEVVFGVEFNALDFSSVHFGLYWQTIREQFPSTPLDRPPIGNIEVLSILPNLRRVWFESKDRKQLIQLQSNRFHYNWRRQSQTEKYPHYAEISPNFFEEWKRFQNWWLNTEGNALQPIRYELTYLNQLDRDFGWSQADDYRKIVSIVSPAWEELPLTPNEFNVNLGFKLAEDQGSLSVSFEQGVRPKDNAPVVLLNLTASHTDTSLEIEKWFETAHKAIVQMFLSLINKDIKKEWGFRWSDQ